MDHSNEDRLKIAILSVALGGFLIGLGLHFSGMAVSAQFACLKAEGRAVIID